MRTLALACVILGGCVLTRPALDVEHVAVCSRADEVRIDVPNLGHWREVTASLEPAEAGQGATHLDGTWQPGSSVLSFQPVRPGRYQVHVTYKGDDGKEREWEHVLLHDPAFASRPIDPTMFGFDAAGPQRCTRLLLAIPKWPDLNGDRAHARTELAAAARRVLDEVIAPTMPIENEAELSRIEAEAAILRDRIGTDAHAPTLVFVVDLRLPNTSGLPCQLMLSVFAAGQTSGELWNRRPMLHQEFVTLPDYTLSSARSQGDMLIRALGGALRSARQVPALRRALGLAAPAEPTLEETLFPDLFEPVEAAPAVKTKPVPSPSEPPPTEQSAAETIGRGGP